MVEWEYRFANSHILVLIPNKTYSKKYSFATLYKSKQKAVLNSDLVCSTYSEVDTHHNRQTEWAGMVYKKIYVNVLVCVWCKKWRNHSAFQSVCFHVTFFVWSRIKLSVAKVCFQLFLYCSLCRCSWCVTIQQTNAFQIENNWNSFVCSLTCCWRCECRMLDVACCFLYSTVFALILRIFDIFHETTCFDRAYFCVWEHFYLTLAILDSIETRSGQEWSVCSLLIIFGSFHLYQTVYGQRKNYSFTNHKLLHMVWPWFVVSWSLLNFSAFFSSWYKYLMQFQGKRHVTKASNWINKKSNKWWKERRT